MRTHIFHIADIHIHAHNYAHIAHAWKQLVAAITSWPQYKTTVILAIAGDIFDHKVWLQADDITLFNSMMADLERNEIRTIMMPGNHDYNINQGGRAIENSSDKILALVKTAGYKFITHCSVSCVMPIDNLAFFIHSPIDLGTPRPGAEHKNFKKIAMVHEPLTNSRTGTGITFQGQRFSAANFAPVFDITLLGDIHLPQKLAQNVAYAGSFVQKNRGEGLEHGYMLWDVEKNNGQFVEIPQLSLYIKVFASGDVEPVLPVGTAEKPIVARGVQLHYSGCSGNWVRKYSSVLQETYKRPVDGAYNKDSLGIAEVKSADNVTLGELDAAILAKLNDPSVATDQRDRVIAIHRKLFEAQSTKNGPNVDWRIRHLSWSNLYCYGEDNWLDFDALDNLNSILGPNKTGKSSIIDILILVLFNETVRGGKKFALNTSVRTGHIKCIISVGGDTYSIERAWIDTNNVVVRLYKNGTNISGSDIPGTYQILENIIGSKRIFVNTAIALQQRQFLVDISSKERYELVCRMIDLDRLRAVEDENKVNIRVEKKCASAFGDPSDMTELHARELKIKSDIDAANASIAAIDSRMSTIRSRIQLVTPDSLIAVPMSCAEISRKVEVIERLGEFRDHALLKSNKDEQTKITAEITRLSQEKAFITEKISSMRASLQPEPKDITLEICDIRISAMSNFNAAATMDEFTKQNAEKLELERTYANVRGELDALTAEIQTNKSYPDFRPSKEIDAEMAALALHEFVVDRIILDEIPRLRSLVDTNTGILQVQQAKLASINAKITSTGEIQAHESITVVSEIEAEIKSCEQLLAGFSQSAESVSRLAALAVDTSNTEIFQWSADCANCGRNKSILSVNDSAIAAELERIETNRKATESRLQQLLVNARAILTHETKQLALTIKSDYNTLVSIYKRRDAAEAANKRHAQLAIQFAASAAYEASQLLIEQKNARISILRPQIAELTEKINRADAAIATMRDQIAMYQSLESLRRAHAIFIANHSIHAEISKFSADLKGIVADAARLNSQLETINATVDRLEYHKNKITEMEELIGMFETARVAEDARDEIETLNTELAEKTTQHKSLLEEVTKLTHSLGMLCVNIKTAEEKNSKIKESNSKSADLELYDRIINHKTGIPMEMMKNVCARIQNKCNEVFEQIADFRIGVVFDDEVHLNVISNIGGTTSVVSAEQSSGYQKFIIDIIMRQVLCSLTATGCPRILFVDEGFGSADESNFGVICRKVLPLLARNFEKVVVVSHIAGIHEYTTGNCIIKTTGDKSKLEFGPRDNERMKLRVLDDHEESIQAANNEKAARKAEEKIKRAAEREQKKQNDKKSVGARLESIGDTIFTRIDSKSVKCEACDHVYKETLGFAAKHIATASHLKNLVSWLKKTDSEE